MISNTTTIRRTVQTAACFISLLAGAAAASAQGTFQNLGFESAAVSPGVIANVPFSSAFPGWSGYVGGSLVPVAAQNWVWLDGSGISILDHAWVNPYGGPPGTIEGNFTAAFSAGMIPGVTNAADLTLSQTGLVPASAQSLWFKALWEGYSPSSAVEVALGGQTLSLFPMGGGTNYTLYAADVRSFSGRTAELNFTLLAQRPHGGDNFLFLDSVQFSDQAVPEPGMLSLFALGALLAGTRALHRRRHTSTANQASQPTPGVRLAAQQALLARRGCARR
jgi:hypothetical protein